MRVDQVGQILDEPGRGMQNRFLTLLLALNLMELASVGVIEVGLLDGRVETELIHELLGLPIRVPVAVGKAKVEGPRREALLAEVVLADFLPDDFLDFSVVVVVPLRDVIGSHTALLDVADLVNHRVRDAHPAVGELSLIEVHLYHGDEVVVVVVVVGVRLLVGS